MKKYLIYIFIALAMTVSLRATDWTILVYMAADNGLHEYALEDIEDMEESLLCNNANIIVQFDGAEWSDQPSAVRYKIGYHPEAGIQSSRIANLGEIDSGDYRTLKGFVEWGFDKYKSNHRALVVWSHGDGWVKDSNGINKYIAPDNTSDNFISMSLHNMQQAVASKYLDLLIYDACTMQSVENLTELNGYADYIIGSEELVPATGYPYTEIFDYWNEHSQVDSLAINIPLMYVDSYLPGNSQNSGMSLIKTSCSTAKMSNWDDFQEHLNSYFLKWSVQAKLFAEARREINEFNHHEVDVDIMELLQYVEENTNNSELKADTSQLLEVLFTVFISYNSSKFSYKVGPATIFFPDDNYGIRTNWGIYSNLYFAQTDYPYFVNKFIQPDETDPLAFEITNAKLNNETLYLEWETVNDPDTLSYYAEFFFEDGELVKTATQYENSMRYHTQQSGRVIIYAVDKTGNETATESKNFVFNQSTGNIYFAPSPIKSINDSNLIIYLPNRKSNNYELSIYNIAGKRLVHRQINLSDSNENIIPANQILKSNLAAGVYYLILNNAGERYQFRFGVEK
jgi:hypothetical protein